MKQLAIFIMLALLLLSGCTNKANDYDEVQHISQVLLYYETTLDGLESRAANIVRGRISGDSEMIFSRSNNINGRPSPLYSVISLDLTEVIKGELVAGETIRIIEPFYIDNRILYTRGNYLPSREGQEYVFYLHTPAPESDSASLGIVGAHFVLHQDRGRYLVPSESQLEAGSFTREELSLGEKDTDIYMNLYQEVIDAYMK